MKPYDSDIRTTWEAFYQRHFDTDAFAVWRRSGEQQAGKRDLGRDWASAFGIEEQPEVAFSFCGAEDRHEGSLPNDQWADLHLNERAAFSHTRVRRAGLGTEGFEGCKGASGQAQFAYRQAELARVAHVEFGQGRGDTVSWRGDLNAEIDARPVAKSIRVERDVEIGRLGGGRAGRQTRTDEEPGQEDYGAAHGLCALTAASVS
jgi:hypothetical protein